MSLVLGVPARHCLSTTLAPIRNPARRGEGLGHYREGRMGVFGVSLLGAVFLRPMRVEALGRV